MSAEPVYYEETEEEELPDDSEYVWQPEAELVEDPILLKQAFERVEKLPRIKPSQFTSYAFRMPTEVGEGENQTLELRPFSFKERPHLQRIYDTASRRVLLLCARQCEKCESLSGLVPLSNGRLVAAGDVQVGHELLALDTSGAANRMSSGRVSWVSKILKKPGLRIKTRQGHVLDVAGTHPIRIWEDWKEASSIVVGDRVAAVRKASSFGCREVSDARVELLGFMLSNGGMTQPMFTYNGGREVSTARCLSVFESIGGTHALTEEGRDCHRLHKSTGHILYTWMEEDGLKGKYSHEKTIPNWVFDLDRRQSALFINRLWSGDGSCKRVDASKYDFEYCTTNFLFCRQLQSLLWKFGIPSSIRENQPSYITVEGEKARLAYILRVETQDGIRTFLNEIGALGKSEGISPPEIEENNNRDTFPIEINQLIRDIVESRRVALGGKHVRPSLRSAGLRETLSYPPTRQKVQRYVEFFSSTTGFDQELVSLLRSHLDTDLYWDVVESVENIGEIDCIDFEVEKHHNFVLDGVVTHNSTLLGNIAISYSCIVPGYKTLYVSPSATQTKTFSADRIKEPLETSIVLRQFTTKMLSQNIMEKQFVNRSKITLRYAFLNADRCIAGSSRIQLADGSLRTVKELVGAGSIEVIASDANGKPKLAVGTHARSMGIKDVVGVDTDFPIPLVCTPDHRVLTGRGWVEAQHLKAGDYIAAPHGGNLSSGVSIGEDAAWLIGALISEGQCQQTDNSFRETRFSNTDLSFITEFEERGRRFGLLLGGRVEDKRNAKICYTINVNSNGDFGLEGAKGKLWELGEFGSKSIRKHIPQAIFKAPLREKASFLQALFRGDGWCCEENVFARSGYSTSSVRLAEDLTYLLWSVGIRCNVRCKLPSTDNAEVSFSLDFSTDYTTKLVQLIKPYRCGLKYRESASKNHNDRIPLSYMDLRQYLKDNYELSTHSAWIEHRIQLRPGNRKDSIGRRVLKDIAYKLSDGYLASLAADDVSWVEVNNVYPCGQQEVFDLTVEGPECFQANGLVVHNCRGVPTYALLLDEIQDILNDNIPVIEACQNHAPKRWRRNIYSGTPKSLDNTIETYWSTMSTMNEWVIPCEGCNTWNILGEKNIGKKGPICSKCGKLLYPQHPRAQWAAQRKFDDVKVPFEGYRINQLMVPWVLWNEVLISYEKNGRDKFYNEVLGISYDSGLRPLTRSQVMACCNPELSMYNLGWYKQHSASNPIFAGIDWGSGEHSFSVLTLGTYVDRKFRVFYMHRFEGEETEPDRQMDIIIETLRFFNVALIGCDYGGGFYPNDKLTRIFGPNKVWKYQYASNPKQAYKWNPLLKRYMLHRTEVMSQIFNAIKRKRDCEFPKWEEFEKPYAQDFLNIYSEDNQTIRMIQYKHVVDKPDDSFHSFIYCWLVSMLKIQRPDIIRPSRENAQGLPTDQYSIVDQG